MCITEVATFRKKFLNKPTDFDSFHRDPISTEQQQNKRQIERLTQM